MSGQAVLQIDKTRKVFAGTAAKILKMLATGQVNQLQAAKANGVDDSYVSQLMADPDFSDQVRESVERLTADAIQIDQDYLEIEKDAVSKLKMQTKMVTNVDQLMRVARFANEAKKKVAMNPLGSESAGTIKPVQLILPKIVVQQITITPNNEIVGVGDRTLVTMNSKSMQSLVQRHKEAIENATEIDVTPKKDAELIAKVKRNGHQSVDPWSDL